MRKLRASFFIMGYWVYIIYSPSTDGYYKGQTDDLTDRLSRHNHGWEKATKAGIPWHLVWDCQKPDRSSAVRLERKLKNLSKERTRQFIIKYSDGVASPDDTDQ